MKTFIKYLIEKRSNPDTNTKIDPYTQLISHRDDANNLYASYTAIDKIGINPQSRYNTPNGIYVYHLPYMLERMSYSKDLRSVPFAGDQPHVWIIKPTTPVMVIQEYTEQQLEQDKEKLRKALGNKFDNIDNLIKRYELDAKNQMPGTKIWNISRGLAEQNPNKWNYILRVILGHSVIRDDGGGVIHPAEPHQGVFLSTQALKVVDKINKKHGYRDSDDDEWKRQNANTIKSSAQRIVEICQKFLKFEKLKDFKSLVTELDEAVARSSNFRLDKALGVKLYNKLLSTIKTYENPYYIVKLGVIINDNNLRKEIAKHIDASLKFAKEMNGRFQLGEKVISKDKKACIEYMSILTKNFYGSPLLNVESDSTEWLKICLTVLGDKEGLNQQIRKYGTPGIIAIHNKFKKYNIPALNDLVAGMGDNVTIEGKIKEFIENGKDEILKQIVDTYKNFKSAIHMTESNLNNILSVVTSYNSKNNQLLSHAHSLLRLFPNTPIKTRITTDLIIDCLHSINSNIQVYDARLVIHELLHSNEINGDLEKTLRNCYDLLKSYYQDLAKTGYEEFNHYVGAVSNGDETEAAESIINKIKEI